MRLTKYQYKRLQADIGGLTTLYAIIKAEKNKEKEPKPRVRFRFLLAERGGFEPPDTFPHRTLSKRVPSTTQPPLHDGNALAFYTNFAYSLTIISYRVAKIKHINADLSVFSRFFPIDKLLRKYAFPA